MTTDVRVVLVTAPSCETARQIAREVVEAQLAACVNVVPGICSIYRWEGRICEDDEVLLVMKTTEPAVCALTGKILSIHPYSVPEVLVLPVEAGSTPYLDWVRREAPG